MSDSRYATSTGATFSLKYHLVWCPKYRRAVLVDAIAARLKELLHSIAAAHGITIHAMEVMPDHVHLFVEAGPTIHPAEMAARFKGGSAGPMRSEFPSLRSRLPALWSRAYFAATVGGASNAAIRRYIEAQKGV